MIVKIRESYHCAHCCPIRMTSSIFNTVACCVQCCRFTSFSRTLGGRLIVFASMILEAWKFDREPIENQLEFEVPDFWLTLERADVTDRTERPDSELIEDKAEIYKKKQDWSFYTNACKKFNIYMAQRLYNVMYLHFFYQIGKEWQNKNTFVDTTLNKTENPFSSWGCNKLHRLSPSFSVQ